MNDRITEYIIQKYSQDGAQLKYSTYHLEALLEESQAEVERLKAENENLKKEIEEYKNRDYQLKEITDNEDVVIEEGDLE